MVPPNTLLPFRQRHRVRREDDVSDFPAVEFEPRTICKIVLETVGDFLDIELLNVESLQGCFEDAFHLCLGKLIEADCEMDSRLDSSVKGFYTVGCQDLDVLLHCVRLADRGALRNEDLLTMMPW